MSSQACKEAPQVSKPHYPPHCPPHPSPCPCDCTRKDHEFARLHQLCMPHAPET